MSNGRRVFLQLSLIAGLIAGVWFPTEAEAGGVAISFGGTVTGPGPGSILPKGVAVGNALSGFFTYNASQTPTSPGSGVFSMTGQSTVQFNFTILPSNFSDTYSPTFTSNNGYTITVDNVHKTLDVHVQLFTATVDPTTNPVTTKTNPFVDLIFTAKNTASTSLLPQTATLFDGNYAFSVAKLSWDPPPIGDLGAPTYGIGADITLIDGQSVVPEPSSLILMGMAATFGVFGLAISRLRKAKAA